MRVTKPVPATGGSYTEGLLKEPRNINPVYASQDTDRDLTRLVFAGLLTYNSEGEIVNDLADKIEISPDAKVYTVYLKKNLKWHDGEPLTARDVVFTIKTIQNSLYKSVLRTNWQGVSADEIGELVVRFTLRTPYVPFMENLTVGIIPAHKWENISPDQAFTDELNLKPVGAGPYEFDSLSQAKDGSIDWYKLSRYSSYHQDGPYLKNLTFKFYKTENEVLAALHKGDLDGFGPLSASRTSEFDNQKVSILSLSMPRLYGIFFNEQKSDVLKDDAVRRAISYAVDRSYLAQKTTSGGGLATDSPLPFLPPQNMYNYDPGKARQILESAGWVKGPGEYHVKKPAKGKKGDPVPLKIKLTTSDWPDLVRAAETISKNLREVGIEVAVETKSFADLEQTAIKPRNFEMLLFGQVYGYEADPYTFWHSSQSKDPGLNITLFSDKKTDKILEDARKIADPAAREKKYQEFSKLLLQQSPAVFLYSQLYLYLLPADMRGVELGKISLPSDRFNEINKWYLSTGRKFSW